MFASNSKSNLQNRALQQSSRNKYFQKLQVGATEIDHKAKNVLPHKRKEYANFLRNQKLLKSMIVAVFLLSIFMYYAFSWINAYVLIF